MKIPKYSCSTCGKPSSREWNLSRHISEDRDFPDPYRPFWNTWQKGAINQENVHNNRPDRLNHFFSSDKSNDRKPDYQYVFMEASIKELAKIAVSNPFSPYTNNNVDSTDNLQIFGFRGDFCRAGA
jgi:hypothetical protein